MESLNHADAAWLKEDRFGARARIGVIVPSIGWTPDHEWPRLLPAGAMHLVTRIPLTSTTPDALAEMGKHSAQAAAMLRTAKIDVLGYGCTVETMMQGAEYDRAVQERLSDAAGAPCVTMTGAVMAALRAVKAQRIAVITPYIDQLNCAEQAFFEKQGYEVAYMRGLGIASTTEIALVPPAQVMDMATEALTAVPDVDALFIGCGNLRSIEVIPEIERRFGLPVVSSNQALVWACLRTAGIPDIDHGSGSLFTRPLA